MSEVWKHQAANAGVQAHGGFSVAQTGVQAVQLCMADRGVHQHKEEDADQSVAVHGRSVAPSTKKQTKRQASAESLQHRPSKEAALVRWPFMYSYREGGCVVNKAPRKSAYTQAEEVGAALL